MTRLQGKRISKRTVDALPVDGKDAVYWDAELKGFGVRVRYNAFRLPGPFARGASAQPPLRTAGQRHDLCVRVNGVAVP